MVLLLLLLMLQHHLLVARGVSFVFCVLLILCIYLLPGQDARRVHVEDLYNLFPHETTTVQTGLVLVRVTVRQQDSVVICAFGVDRLRLKLLVCLAE